MNKILLPVAGDPTVSIAFSFAVGSQDDPAGREGLTALTAALLTEGATEHHSYDEILELLYPLATDYAATIDKELSTIDGRVHCDRLDEFVTLMLDALLRPAFRKDDFERLKSDAINQIRSTLRFSSDEELAKHGLTAAVFAGTPYAHPVEGTIRGIERISLDDVRAFYRERFVRARMTLAVAGGFDDTLIARLEQALAALPEGRPAAPPAVEPRAGAGRQVVLIDKPGADASISIGTPLAARRGERDFYALWIANSWLGEHRHGASHLYQLIREARGMNYGNYTYIEAFPDGGELQMPTVNVARRQQLFEIWLRTLPNEQAVFAIRCALRELDRLIEHGLTAQQFALTRAFLKKYSTHYAPTTAARLGYAIDDAFYGIGGDGHLAQFKCMMDELTLDEVNAASRKYWQTATLTIAIVTGEAGRIARELTSGEPTPIEYSNPMADAILAEDQLIAAYPLSIRDTAITRWPVQSLFDEI
jgi:zinc protease